MNLEQHLPALQVVVPLEDFISRVTEEIRTRALVP